MTQQADRQLLENVARRMSQFQGAALVVGTVLGVAGVFIGVGLNRGIDEISRAREERHQTETVLMGHLERSASEHDRIRERHAEYERALDAIRARHSEDIRELRQEIRR